MPDDDLTKGGLAYIRARYRVPAAALIRIQVNNRAGFIIGTDAARLIVRYGDQGDVLFAHPTWKTRYLPAVEEDIAFLQDVFHSRIYRVEQRSSKYAMNRRTYNRCTRAATRCASLDLIRLVPDGVTAGTYALTDEGEATLAAHQRLVDDGPFIPPTPTEGNPS